MSDFIIQTKMLDVTKWLFLRVNTFPKAQRFVLGQQIEGSALNSLRLIVEANNARTPATTLTKLVATWLFRLPRSARWFASKSASIEVI